MLKDKNENLEISIDTLEKSNSVLHQSNNNLQKSFDSSSLNSIASQIVTNSIAGAKGFVLISTHPTNPEFKSENCLDPHEDYP